MGRVEVSVYLIAERMLGIMLACQQRLNPIRQLASTTRAGSRRDGFVGTAEGKNARLFSLAIDLAEKVIASARCIRAADEGEMLYKMAMLFFFTKAYKTYQAIYTLVEAGFTEDAFALSRFIFEVALQARYMKEAPIPRAKLFAQHEPVVRYRYYKQLKSLGDTQLIAGIESRREQLEELKQWHDRFAAQYPKGRGWWGQSIKWLAEHLCTEMKKRYVGLYWMESNIVHSGVTSAREYIKSDDKGLTVRCYPSQPKNTMVTQEAALYFLNVVVQAAQALELRLDDEIQSALEDFESLTAGSDESKR